MPRTTRTTAQAQPASAQGASSRVMGSRSRSNRAATIQVDEAVDPVQSLYPHAEAFRELMQDLERQARASGRPMVNNMPVPETREPEGQVTTQANTTPIADPFLTPDLQEENSESDVDETVETIAGMTTGMTEIRVRREGDEPANTQEDEEHLALLEAARAYNPEEHKRRQEAKKKKKLAEQARLASLAEAEKKKLEREKARAEKKRLNPNWLKDYRKHIKGFNPSEQVEISVQEKKVNDFLLTLGRDEFASYTHSQKYMTACYLGKKQQETIVGKRIFINDYGCEANIKRIIHSRTWSNDLIMEFYPIRDDGTASSSTDSVALRSCEFLDTIDENILPNTNTPSKAISRLITSLNEQVNSERRNLIHNEARTKRDLRSSTTNIAMQRANLTQISQRLANTPEEQLAPDVILEQMEEIAKHKDIDEVYLSEQGNIFVQTKPLKLVNREELVPTDTDLGRMLFRYSYITNRGSSNRPVMAHNMDWSVNKTFGHPNLKYGGICQGENQIEIGNMFKARQLYMLTDFLVTFFTLYPQDGGQPYMGFEAWLRDRNNVIRNPYGGEVRI